MNQKIDETSSSVRVNRGAVAAIWVPTDPAATADWWTVTVRSLDDKVQSVFVGSPGPLETITPGADESLQVSVVSSSSGTAFVNDLWRDHREHLLIVSAGVVVPTGFLDRAIGLLDEDKRVASVSFVTNDGGMLSFPDRNRATPLAPGGLDQESITARLRGRTPSPGRPAIPFAVGPAVLVSKSVLRTMGPLREPPSGDLRAAMADLCLRSRPRGFTDVLDCSTFVLKPSDLNASDWSAEPWVQRRASDLSLEDEEWLFAHHPWARVHLEMESESPTSPSGLALNVARTKVQGLRILIDGRSLHGSQMGTQTASMCLIDALGRHPDVSDVCVAVSEMPPSYAREALSGDGVRVSVVGDGGLGGCGRFDVGHRPYNPGDDYSGAEWRSVADRHVVTLLDLIAYDMAEHFRSLDGWQQYRARVHEVTREADGIVVISADVETAVARASLPIDASRVFTVPLGTDHADGSAPSEPPEELLRHRMTDSPFLLCLGTNLVCRNRDVAIDAWRVLKERGYDHELVLVGASVPSGSSRVLERIGGNDKGLYDLPSVSAPARDWLLAHAALVLCSSSADGFGLVPFEAARAGTASLSVCFGPFREFGCAVPVWADEWNAESFADAAQRVLDDPAIARDQVQARLDAGGQLTWARCADELVQVYRELLARPPEVPDAVGAAEAKVRTLTSEHEALQARLDALDRSRSVKFARKAGAWLRPFHRD